MSYEKYYSGGWQSGETGGTPITPEALNHMEQGIANLDSEKAPAGYGLGENQAKMVNDANAITEIGFFQSISNTPDESQWWFILHFKHQPTYNHAKQLAFSVQSGHICVRSCYSEWQPWEWVNPPMVPDVEYRTTERFEKKPVYVKMINIGYLPNAARNYIHDVLPTEASVFSIDGYGETANGEVQPLLALVDEVWAIAKSGYIGVITSADRSGYDALVSVKYTKSTD